MVVHAACTKGSQGRLITGAKPINPSETEKPCRGPTGGAMHNPCMRGKPRTLLTQKQLLSAERCQLFLQLDQTFQVEAAFVLPNRERLHLRLHFSDLSFHLQNLLCQISLHACGGTGACAWQWAKEGIHAGRRQGEAHGD